MYPEDEYKLLASGYLYLPRLGLYLSNGVSSPSRDYCLEEIVERDHVSVVVCTFPGMSGHDDNVHSMDNNSTTTNQDMFSCDVREVLLTGAMIASILGLAITLLVYIRLPELRNLPGKNLVSMCLSLLVGYALLATIRLVGGSHAMPKYLCIMSGMLGCCAATNCHFITSYKCVSAVVLMYAFLAAFSWTTLISLDICITFGRWVNPLVHMTKN